MNKDKVLYGIIAVLTGLLVGYIGTTYINNAEAPETNQTQEMPTNHPPVSR